MLMVSKSIEFLAWLILCSGAVICYSLSPFATQAQSITDVLPSPTGPYKTGRMSFHWIDTPREELETKATGDKRELMVHVFLSRRLRRIGRERCLFA